MQLQLLTLALLFLLSGCGWGGGKLSSSERRPERWYSESWCESRGGDAKAVLSDGSRPDCVAGDLAVEFDFGEGTKPYECAGQARHYAKLSGKRPLCILIRRSGSSLSDFRRSVLRVDAPVKCMDASARMISCD